MDAVCVKGDWDVVMEQDPKGNLLGILVFHIRKYRGFTLILMPPMTPYNGLYFFYPPGTKDHSKISHQNKVTEALFAKLPKHDLYAQQFHPSYQNWLQLYWQKYKATVRYTYYVDKTLGEEALLGNLKGNLRRGFKQIEESCIIEEHDFNGFWPQVEKSFRLKKKPVPYNKEVIQRLFDAFYDRGQITVLACRHKETNDLVSGVMLAKDKMTTYFLASFQMPDIKPAGAMGYNYWKGIFYGDTEICDFEGSMIKDIEFFLRSYGGVLTPHYKIHKVHSPLLKVALNLFKPGFFD